MNTKKMDNLNVDNTHKGYEYVNVTHKNTVHVYIPHKDTGNTDITHTNILGILTSVPSWLELELARATNVELGWLSWT